MATVTALVDYDNATRGFRELTHLDAESNLFWLASTVANYVSTHHSGANEVSLRLYGGWLDENGQPTHRAAWLYSMIGNVRGRYDGLRVLPHIVVTIARCPDVALMGLCRKRGGKAEQKMVDTMLTVDTLYYAKEPGSLLLVLSDDDDLVPGLLAAASRRMSQVKLLRRRPDGIGLNDSACRRYGATIDRLPERVPK